MVINTNSYRKRKHCYFTSIDAKEIDYKDVELLKNYITDTRKIIPSRVTGTKVKYQRMLAKAIKRARLVGLLPHTDRYEQPFLR